MLKELLSTRKGLLGLSLIILLTLLLTDLLGLLKPFEIILTERINKSPLPKAYFPTFLVVGFFIPLIIRVNDSKDSLTNLILTPYLYLLFCQIITEFLFVLTIGKGMGVIIGILFSSLRIVQLRFLWFLANKRLNMKILVAIQVFLWSVNIIQITFNRLVPIIINN